MPGIPANICGDHFGGRAGRYQGVETGNRPAGDGNTNERPDSSRNDRAPARTVKIIKPTKVEYMIKLADILA